MNSNDRVQQVDVLAYWRDRQAKYFFPLVESSFPTRQCQKEKKNSDRTTAFCPFSFFSARLFFFFNGFSRSIETVRKNLGFFLFNSSRLSLSNGNNKNILWKETRGRGNDNIRRRRKKEARVIWPGHKKSIHAILGKTPVAAAIRPRRRRWMIQREIGKKNLSTTNFGIQSSPACLLAAYLDGTNAEQGRPTGRYQIRIARGRGQHCFQSIPLHGSDLQLKYDREPPLPIWFSFKGRKRHDEWFRETCYNEPIQSPVASHLFSSDTVRHHQRPVDSQLFYA